MNIAQATGNSAKVYEYLSRHPGSISSQIARDLKIPITSVQSALKKLEQESLIESGELIRPPGCGYMIRPYWVTDRALHQETTVSELIGMARAIGGHFGMLAAQIMRGKHANTTTR